MRVTRTSLVLLSALTLILSCSDPVGPGAPTNIIIVSGSGQSGIVGSILAQPIIVEVKDVDGRLVGGADVLWIVSGGGGAVSAAETTTNSSGRAQVQWTLGTTAGENRIRVSVTDIATSVIATGQADAPAAMTLISNETQTGLVSRPLGQAVRARVVDAHGNGVPGLPVTFSPSAGTVSSPTVTTNGGGVAQVVWTLGPTSGEQTLDVSAGGLQPLNFIATALSLDEVPELENVVPAGPFSSDKGVNRYFRIMVPDGVLRLTIATTGGPGDVDMFVRRGILPTTTSENDCESTSPEAVERCTVEAPLAGEWFILLDAYSSYSDVSIRGEHVIGGSLAVDVSGLSQVPASIDVTGPGGYYRLVPADISITSIEPGSYTITANQVLAAETQTVYAATPEVQQIEIAAGVTASVSVVYAETSGELNLDITAAYITQAVQRRDGSVPLISGRGGLLRVFARGNAFSDAVPTVRARFYQNGMLVDTRTIASPSTTVPISHDEGILASTWNVVLPASLIQPGLSMLVDVDPTNAIAEPDESDNSFPASGTPAALDVRTAPVLRARFVPVIQNENDQGDVTAANLDTYIDRADAIYPLPGITADVRAPYSFDGVLPNSYDSTWQRLLMEINGLRIAEDPDVHYYGVIKPTYGSGGTGFGYIGQRAAVGVEWPNWRSETVAHEWGHNFGRFHVDCGGPTGLDPNYPYENGELAHHGYDLRTNQIRSIGTHHDVMSYCQPTWSSDYTYEAVMDYRATQAGVAAAEPSLLVWGRISPDGAVLEPSFEVVTRPTMPGKSGAYRLTGKNGAGATVLDISFDGYEIDHLPGVRHFAYAIPLRSLRGEMPSELRIRGAGIDAVRRQSAPAAGTEQIRIERDGVDRVRVRWNATRNPVVMVRDSRTGMILSFARGGDAYVMTRAAEVEVNMSDGVKSTVRQIRVTR